MATIFNVGTFMQSMKRECGDTEADGILASDWLQSRYAQILERAPWQFLQTEATFQTVAEITAGTVTVTLGSTTVTETTSNANGWSSSVANRYFRRDGTSQFYLISSFADANPDTLTLNRNYEDPTATTAGYSLFQRIYSLATDVREVLSMVWLDDAQQTLEKVSTSKLDDAYPSRSQVGTPKNWAPLGRDSSDSFRIELYPIPQYARGILYRYIIQTPATADADTDIIEQVNFGLLRAGWLADYWSWRLARKDAPQWALSMSQKYELEFERRLQEMLMREAAAQPAEPLRHAKHRNWHRWVRANKFAARTIAVSEDT